MRSPGAAPVMEIETRSAYISLEDEIILVARMKEGVDIDVDHILENFEAMAQFNPINDFPILLDAGNHMNITKEARELAASKGLAPNRSAMAIMVPSISIRLLGNFYIKVNKPARPTQLFTNRELAIQWLKEQYRKHKNKSKGARETFVFDFLS